MTKKVKKQEITVSEVKLEAVKQKGRPVNLNSPRQLRLKEQEERKAAGIIIQRGRPVNENSARQMKLNRIAEMKANGTYKLGRPKMIKVEEQVEA
jgi:hypothetical protein